MPRKELIPGGLAAGMSPRDFNARALRQGTLVELEHTGDRGLAQEIAMDHLVEDPRYYAKLAKVEMTPNRRKRVKVYDTRDQAIAMRERFTDRPYRAETEFDWDWPVELQNVGDSLAVAYASDKWKPKKKNGRRALEDYKHLAESRNRILCLPGIVAADDEPDSPYGVVGPFVSFEEVPMPEHFAVLGLFREANVQLYTDGTDTRPIFSDDLDGDDGVVTLTVGHGMLGGSYIPWSQQPSGRRKRDQPFLFVYTAGDGIMFVILGDKLAVLKDGIVG